MSEFQQGLLITAIGMGLVFAVIIFLWGLMALMMRVTSGRKQEQNSLEEPPAMDAPVMPEIQKTEAQRRAAAAATAVGIALSVQKVQAAQTSEDRSGELSPWQAVHRPRQFNRIQRRG
ncbi:MAG TPA: OadG family protein [Brevefilum sp.]